MYQTWTTSRGKRIKCKCIRQGKKNFMCSGYAITSEDLVVQIKERHCSTCMPSTNLSTRTKKLEQKILAELCRGADNVGSVIKKINKALTKAVLIPF